MNKIRMIRTAGLKVTFKLLAVGLMGRECFPRQIVLADVIEYMKDRLSAGSDYLDTIIRLLCEADDTSSFYSTIINCANIESTDWEDQIIKWELISVKQIIHPNDSVAVNNSSLLFDLYDYWLTEGCIAHCPIDFPDSQIRGSYEEFFSLSSIAPQKRKVINWIENECSRINARECNINTI